LKEILEGKRTNSHLIQKFLHFSFKIPSIQRSPKAIAAIKSLERVAQLGMTHIILETFAQVLRDALHTMIMDWNFNGGLFKRIRDMMYTDFVSCFVSVVPRACHSIADCLAAHGANELSAGSQVFTSHAPNFVLTLVYADLPGSGV
jgi:hypothetical protein